jgi:CspA family cold shock protein
MTLKFKRDEYMAQGKIKWFDPKKGYGFITPDDGTKDAFLHISALETAGISQLEVGQAVSYELAEQRGKQSATEITVI